MIVRIVYFMLSSSNQKYDPFAIAYGYVIKQWYALCVFLHSNVDNQNNDEL